MALKALADRICREARSFDQVEEGRLSGRKAYKFDDRIFLHVDVLRDCVEMNVLLPPTDYKGVLNLPFALPHRFEGPPWVTLRLHGTEPFNLVRSWIRKSYELRVQEAPRRHADRETVRAKAARKPTRHGRAARA